MIQWLLPVLFALASGDGGDIIGVTCTTREGNKVSSGVSDVSCSTNETLVSCGISGTQNIGGARIPPSSPDTCSILQFSWSSGESSSPVAVCCTFPSGSVLDIQDVVSSPGVVVDAECPADYVLTGCHVYYDSGTTNVIRGSFTGDQSGAPQTSSWISTDNKCTAESSASESDVTAGARCILFDPYYSLTCETKASLTNYALFGTCNTDFNMFGCNTYLDDITFTLDAYYVDSTEQCYVQMDGHYNQYANAVCCQLTEAELPTYDVTFTQNYNVECDNSLSLWQSDDRGESWTEVYNGYTVGSTWDNWHPETKTITVNALTILRFGCWDYGGTGGFYGTGITVDGEDYPVTMDSVNAGYYEFVGWETTCEGICNGGTDCHNDVPVIPSDINEVVNPDAVTAVGGLVEEPMWGGIWATSALAADGYDPCGMLWVDFDFINTVISGDVYYCDSSPDSVDWDTLTADGVNIPSITWNINVTDDDLSLSIHVELEYLGYATADKNDEDYGTTYVLDFEDFNAHEDDIFAPGSCQNRVADDFYESDGTSLRAFEEWWQYSDIPETPNHIGNADFMAYPPPNDDKWTISMKDDDDCHTVVYDGYFTWNDLVSCNDGSDGDSYVSTVDDGEADGEISLSGVFYVNVVSPYHFSEDLSGYYRVYQILSQPFVITISKSVYVVGEAGMNVLSMSVIAVYKEDGMNIFKLVVLTESQNYLALTRASNGSSGYTFAASGGANIVTGDFVAPLVDETAGECLGNKEFICSQLWEIYADIDNCTEKGIDFSGLYTLSFETGCRADVDGNSAYYTYCVGWLDEHPDINGGVDLTAKLTWRDDVCDPELFEVQFEAEMNFYTDIGFTTSGNEPYLFQVGEDTVYVEIDTGFPDGTYNVFDTELRNVWICTFDPLYDVPDPDPNSLSGGCFDGERDGGNVSVGNDYYYQVYSSDGPIENEEMNLIGHPDDTDDNKDKLRFYFDIPHKIARDTLWVHAQVEVTLTGPDSSRRRVLLNVDASANQMNHFIGNIGIKSKNNAPQQPYEPYRPQPPQEPINYNPPQNVPYGNTWNIDLSSPWILVLGALLAVVLCANVVFMCYYNCCGQQQQRRYSFNRRRRSGYSSVKGIDSQEFDESEANAINVASD